MEKINTLRRAPFGSNPAVGDAGRATQQRIIGAANEVFAELGYARTSVEAITDRAGCSRPTFYQYFAGKEDLHRRLAGRLGAELAELTGQLDTITPDRDGREVIHQWICRLVDVYGRYRAVANNFSASLRTDDRMVSGAASLSTEYQRALATAVDGSSDAPIPIEILAGVANVAAFGACIYRDRIGDVSADRFAAALTDTLHRAFLGPIEGVNLAPRVAPEPTAPRATPINETESDAPTRQGRGLHTRRRLHDAAALAFATLGYDGVRIDDIAGEADVSHGTFYRYYRDKDAAFDEHAEAATEATTQLLEQLPLSDGTERQWVADYYDIYELHRGVISCLREARAADVAGAIAARESSIAGWTQALQTRPFGDVDADIVTCFALLENVPAAAYGYSELTVDGAIDGTAVLLSRGLFGRAG